VHTNDCDRARLAGTHANVGRKRGKPEAEPPHSIHLTKLLRNLRVRFRRNDKDILCVGLPYKSSQPDRRLRHSESVLSKAKDKSRKRSPLPSSNELTWSDAEMQLTIKARTCIGPNSQTISQMTSLPHKPLKFHPEGVGICTTCSRLQQARGANVPPEWEPIMTILLSRFHDVSLN